MKQFLLVGLMLALGLTAAGCKRASIPIIDDPEDGGVVYQGNPNAPKEIQSRNITEFSLHFLTFDRYDRENTMMTDIQVAADESGQYILSVKGLYNHTLPVDVTVLEGVQEIIESYDLVKKNGDGRVVAGLPPDFEPWELSVLYDSGEKLYFYENGDIDAEWSMAMRDYFVRVMADAGYDDVLPQAEQVTITEFDFDYRSDEEKMAFYLEQYPDDESVYLYYDGVETTVRAEVTEELFTGLQEVIENNQIDHMKVPLPLVIDKDKPKVYSFSLNVDYESGRYLSYDFKIWKLDEEWLAVKDVLKEYFEGYISEHKID